MFLKHFLMDVIGSFQGNYRFLSNFWPCCIVWEGFPCPTLEHAYAASKTDDPAIKMMIRSCPTPGDAKEWLAVHNMKPSAGWMIPKKLQVMEELLFLKFGGREPFLTRALMATGDAELVEGNTWDDTFWGVWNGVGENNLGRLLMKVRKTLFEEKALIEKHLSSTDTHQQLSDASGLTRLALYEKMLAFDISQRKYLGY
ncbi:MAG: NADAR family protein [Bacteroidota bacterium]